jgi:hypothetical protein
MLCAALSQAITREDNFSVDFKGEERMMGEMTGTFLIIFFAVAYLVTIARHIVAVG